MLWKRSLSALFDRSVYSEKWFQYMEYRPKCEFIMFQPVVAAPRPIFQPPWPRHSNRQSISHSSGRNLSYAASNFQKSGKVLWKCVCVFWQEICQQNCIFSNLALQLGFLIGIPIGINQKMDDLIKTDNFGSHMLRNGSVSSWQK